VHVNSCCQSNAFAHTDNGAAGFVGGSPLMREDATRVEVCLVFARLEAFVIQTKLN
jgi:homoserine kinase